jgi:hypothetical protein
VLFLVADPGVLAMALHKFRVFGGNLSVGHLGLAQVGMTCGCLVVFWPPVEQAIVYFQF